MRFSRYLLVLTSLGAAALAQTTGSAAVGQNSTSVKAQTQASPSTAAQSAPAGAQAAPAGPQHRTPPSAKTQEEFTAYTAAAQNPDLAAAEKAADDFVTKFPDSNLKALLYNTLMRRYQQADNSDRALEMARKELQYDPEETTALVTAATALAEHTRDSDLDRDERYDEATKYAQKAIATIDTGLMVPPNAPEEQVQQYKKMLLSAAHQALGMVYLQQAQAATDRKPPASDQEIAALNAKSEAEDSQAIAMAPAGQIDPLIYLRLAVAQDHQQKYDKALDSANKAVQASADNPNINEIAKREVERLRKLTGSGAKPAPATSTPGSAPASSTTPK